MEVIPDGAQRVSMALSAAAQGRTMDSASIAAAAKVKIEGEKTDLIERIADDDMFGLSMEELNAILDAKNFIGRSAEQVDEFVDGFIAPVLEKYKDEIGFDAELKV